MKRFLIYVVSLLLCVVILFVGILAGVLCLPADTFGDTYQAVLQRKYDTLMQTDEPKIIIVGGSNASFGIDEEMIEKATGYRVANMGLHAGFGAIVPSELAKANINEGDIVLLAYEWGWQNGGYFDIFGTDLVMSGIDHRVEMYRHLPSEHYKKIIGYLGEHAMKKITHQDMTGIYSSASFDEKGRMIADRPESALVYEGNEAVMGVIDVSNAAIAPDVIEYLQDYKAFVEGQNAKIYFVAPPFYKGATSCTAEQFQAMVQVEEEMIGIDYISDPYAYLFPQEYIFDTPYHCTNTGEAYRTQLLISDLATVMGG